jgi:hypothetical protein
MNSVALVIHDVNFPYNLFEEALEWAKEHEAELKAIFLTNEPITMTTNHLLYGYRDSEELSTIHSLVGGAQAIIARHLRFIEQRAAACHLPFKSVILIRPSLDQAVGHMRYADKVFMEYGGESRLPDLSFSWEDLADGIPARRQVISNKSFE